MSDDDDLVASDKFAFSAGVVCACMVIAGMILAVALAGCSIRPPGADEDAVRKIKQSAVTP